MADESPLPILPFAGRDPATRAAVGAAVASVENLSHKLVRKYMPGAGASAREEAAQDIRVHLAIKAAPKFDRSRGTKWSTFSYRVISNLLLAKVRARPARKKRSPYSPIDRLQDIALLDLEAPDRSQDRAIERLAAAIIENPNGYGLTPVQQEVLRAILAAPPEATLSEIGRALGYSAAPAFSTALGRVKAKLVALDIEGADN